MLPGSAIVSQYVSMSQQFSSESRRSPLTRVRSPQACGRGPLGLTSARFSGFPPSKHVICIFAEGMYSKDRGYVGALDKPVELT